MYKKLFDLIAVIMLISLASSVQAEPFSLGAVEDITLGNDARYGPDSSSNGSGLEARDIPSRRHVVLISYDISALKSAGQFSNVSFSHFSHDQHGETNVYGVIESLDLLEVESLTWNTAPGVQNNPTPVLDSPIALDLADLTDILLTFAGPGQTGVRFSTDTSQALADFLNSDTDGIVTFLFAASAENNQLIVRSMEHAEGGSFLEGELSPILEIALDPNPVDEAANVIRDVVLSWTPGQFADKHNVYLGTNFNDVNSAGSGSPQLVGPAEDANSYDAGRLEFDQTYYWRIDEVNAPPDSTVFRGPVWSFTIESLAYPIPGESITATASSAGEAGFGPEKTIDGSGLDENGLHSTGATDMWLSGSEPLGAWIQYELDNVYKLHEMWVWNSNQVFEGLFGFGMKDVTVEYSADGVEWTVLAGVPEFAQASGASDYGHNTTVDLDGAVAKHIRLTTSSNWGGILPQYGLSEVRFFSIPVSAREPSPDTGATDVDVDGTLSWRAGRQAAEHNVYLSTDEQVVVDGNAPVNTVTDASYSPSPLDLATTYYWRVDEVNDAETPTTWQGDLWNFTTQEFIVVEDFEDYNDWPPHEIYTTWLDGYENPANGSQIGYLTPPSVETTIVHGGNQSAPLLYDNSVASLSEVTVNTDDLAIGRDWAIGSPKVLVLWIYGDPGNTGNDQLYVKISNAKFPYDGDIARPQWKPMIIDLTGVNLNNVSSLTIGIERAGGSGGSGVVLLDEIVLAASAPVVPSEEVWVEAEANNSITAPMMIHNDPDASGGQYVGTEAGTADEGAAPPYPNGTVSIPFTVEGGTYTARLRIGFPGGDDSCWVRIQNATITSPVHSSGWIHFNDIPRGDYWHWSQEVKSEDESGEPPVRFTLSAGTHNLEISYRGADLRIDA
ncbi:MAG: discoidin domain-containing protein, partial [Planctomycetota bacterium]